MGARKEAEGAGEQGSRGAALLYETLRERLRSVTEEQRRIINNQLQMTNDQYFSTRGCANDYAQYE
ncbi:MAG: hypothetical protein V7K77_01440 [Nostoc sp.]|uniref:hypothetical protein n=1 Tax=Nostoc sp. TaxID=1180 RepID=UPI002FFB7209